ERDDLSKLFDRYVGDGRGAVTAGRTDCKSADRQLTELEQSLAGPSLSGVIGPSAAAAAPAPNPPVATQAPPAPAAAPPVSTAPPAAAAPQPAAPTTMAATTPTVPPASTNLRGINS